MDQSLSTEFAKVLALSTVLLSDEGNAELSACLEKELATQLPLVLDESKLKKIEKLVSTRLACSGTQENENKCHIFTQLAEQSNGLFSDLSGPLQTVLAPIITSILSSSLKLVPKSHAESFSKKSIPVHFSLLEEYFSNKAAEEEDSVKHILLILNVIDCLLNSFDIQQSELAPRFKTLVHDFIFCSSDSISSFAISNFLPRVISHDHNELENVWDQLLSRKTYCESNLTPFCLLMNIFLLDESSSSFMQKNQFWQLVQNGIISRDQVIRKQARFMLKRALDFINSHNIKIKTDYFEWKPESNLDLWQDFFLVVESLEEKQVHIIKPILSLIDKLFKELDPQWAALALRQAVHHENNHIVKWGLNFFFGLEHSPTKVDFFLQHLMPALDNTSLYYESDLGEKLESFTKAVALSSENEVFFKAILPAGSSISWGPVPLFFICKSLGDLPRIEVWDSEDLKEARKFLVESMSTQDVFIRATCQSMLLRATLRLIDLSKTSMEAFLDLLASFSRKESLCRGLGDWQLVVDFIKSNKEIQFSPKEFLAGHCNSEPAKVSVKAAARYFVLMQDAGVLKKEILDAFAGEFEWQLTEIETRPYCISTSPNQIDSLMELIVQVFIETGLPFEWEDSLLAQLMNPKSLIGVWGYLRMRLEGADCLDVELVHVYVDCFKLILQLDQNLNKLFDASQVVTAASRIIGSKEVPLMTKYFAAKTLEAFTDELKSVKNYLSSPTKASIILAVESMVQTGLINEIKFSESSSVTAAQRNRIISGILSANWHSFSMLLESEEDSSVKGLPHDTVLSLAEDAVERGGAETLSKVMACLRFFLFREEDAVRIRAILKKTFCQCFEHRKSELFWTSIREFVKMAFSSGMLERVDLEEDLIKFTDSLHEHSQTVAGLFNLIVENLCCQFQTANRITVHQFQLAVLFGPIVRKDQKILIDVCLHIMSLGAEIPSNSLLESNCQAGQLVRAAAGSFLLRQLPRSIKFSKLMAEALISKDAEMNTNKKLRYFAESQEHRMKHRISQTLLIISCCSPTEETNRMILEWATNSLANESHQPSVRYNIEWLMSLILIKCWELKDDFFAKLLEATSRKINSIPSFVSVLYLWIIGFAEKNFDKPRLLNLLNSTVELLLPWCMAQTYNIRLYGQVALLRIFAFCEKSGLQETINSFSVLKTSVESSVEQSSGVKNAILLQEDFFFCVLNPVGHLSLESIFVEFPRLTNVGGDEWLPNSMFNLREADLSILPFPLKNSDDLLANSKVANWIIKATGGTTDLEEEKEASYSIVQRKVTPWSAMFPENCVREHRTPPLGGLVIVASLIDKAPNLGGLSRTCEIFGASELVIGNMKIVDDPMFQSLSVTAEKWMNLSEVKPTDLVEYLNFMKKQGYTLMAAEQTSKSQPLQSVKFSKRSLILLGNEKEGIPAELLPFLDVCVEIPQMGIIRSLNVHVTGALFIWQYFQQHALQA